MRYGIEIVGDEAMPEGCDFVLVQGEGSTRVFYRESAFSPKLVQDGWAALHAIAPDLLEPARLNTSEPRCVQRTRRRRGLSMGALVALTEFGGAFAVVSRVV